MSCDIEPARPGERLHRVGRAPNPWAWPDWAYAGPDGTFGNRYDDPAGEYRVLYASGERVGAFLEVLARFRPDPAVRAELAEIEGEERLRPPGVSRSWIKGRLVGSATVQGEFAAVAHSRSLAYLRLQLAPRVLHYGLADLDAGTLRLRAPRAFTQEVSRLVYECSGDDDSPQFAGIAYGSRLGDDIRNWAIVERGSASLALEDIELEPIAADDPDLRAALGRFGLGLIG
jgi:RES domain